MTETRKRKWICTLLLIANLSFIWGNSLMDGSRSGDLSGGVLAWINQFLGLGEAGAEMLHHLIRKAAHFTEFACLGALLAWRCGMGGVEKTYLVTTPLLGAMMAACVDETIQIYVEGRGSSLTDVWVDTFGALTGIMLLILGHHVCKKCKKQYLEETI